MPDVYISSHDFAGAKALAARLEAAGIGVVSTWHNETPIAGGRGCPPTDREYWDLKVRKNFGRMRCADVLVLVAGPDKYAGGKFVEAGYALASGTEVVVLGRPENGMIGGAATKFFENESDLFAYLKIR